jgi:hypothetical protein
MVNVFIEIKRNATGHYFFIYKSVEDFFAVSSSFMSRSLLEGHLANIRKYGPSCEVYFNATSVSFPCIEVEIIESTLYRFQYLLSLNHSLMQSDLAFSLEVCLKRIQHFQDTIDDARIVDLTQE